MQRAAPEGKKGLLIAEGSRFRKNGPQNVAGKDEVLYRSGGRVIPSHAQHAPGLFVHRSDMPVVIQHDNPFVQHLQCGLLFTKQLTQTQLLGNGITGRFHHAAGMVMKGIRRKGDIEHPFQPSFVPDRRGGTKPVVQGAAEMLRSARFHGFFLYQTNGNGIGAGRILRRDVARRQMRDGISGGGVPQRMQHHAVRVGQGNKAA